MRWILLFYYNVEAVRERAGERGFWRLAGLSLMCMGIGGEGLLN
jgi:hypothetical protein